MQAEERYTPDTIQMTRRMERRGASIACVELREVVHTGLDAALPVGSSGGIPEHVAAAAAASMGYRRDNKGKTGQQQKGRILGRGY